MEMKISNRKITKSNLYFIVEEAQANQGSVSVALEMIEKAKYAGADAIEFQLFITDDFYIKTHRAYERYKANEFSLEEIQKLIDYAKSFEIDFIATPLSHNLVDDLKRMGCDGFNIDRKSTRLNSSHVRISYAVFCLKKKKKIKKNIKNKKIRHRTAVARHIEKLEGI